MELNIKIDLNEEDIEYLKWFKIQHRPEMKGYNSIIWHLEYLGVLITTNIDYDNGGKYCDKTYVMPTGIGKIILEML